MASTEVKIEDLEGAIREILGDYEDVIFNATEEGLSAGEKILIKRLKEASPKDIPEYYKKWKGTKKKYKLRRFVGNTKTVKGAKSDTIPLSNVLEYSSKSPHQGLIKNTYEKSINEIASAIINEIKKEA